MLGQVLRFRRSLRLDLGDQRLVSRVAEQRFQVVQLVELREVAEAGVERLAQAVERRSFFPPIVVPFA
jgi:hypothetical protein